MTDSPNIAALAAPLADPARARMVLALMDGRARTVGELGAAAGLGKASASEHLAKLTDAGFLKAERQGRHKYLTLASPEVAGLIEAMMALAGRTPARLPQIGPRDPALREARLCYNHLAGALGVRVYRSLSACGYLAHRPGGLDLTPSGRAFCHDFGLTETDLAPARTPLCRDCLDWSERQSHLGGRLGRLLLQRMEALGWLRRRPEGRALIVTPEGRRAIGLAFLPDAEVPKPAA
ncbi:MAG: transcriptional regulator [Rhodobacter sp.]|nr:transcriptional regulator [Rhodobacter sp.]